MKFLSTIWKGLGEKGKVATIIGLFFAVPANGKFLYSVFKGIELSNQLLINIALMNCIAMVWFILPSKISIKGKPFEIIVED